MMSRFRAFMRGALSIFDFPFDLSGNMKISEIVESVEFPYHPAGFRICRTDEEARVWDAAAIVSDRQVIGNDLRKAMKIYEQKQAGQT